MIKVELEDRVSCKCITDIYIISLMKLVTFYLDIGRGYGRITTIRCAIRRIVSPTATERGVGIINAEVTMWS